MNEQIEAIRNEIKRLEEIHERNLKKPMERGRIGYAHGVVACCDILLAFIDSLPEEPNKSLEEAAEKYATEWHKNPDGSAWKPYFEVSAIKAFIAGAEWRYQKDRAEFAKLKAKEWSDGYNEGITKGKEQMMKEAVEGYVTLTLTGALTVAATIKEGDNIGISDKVRIIIVKEDKK